MNDHLADLRFTINTDTVDIVAREFRGTRESVAKATKIARMMCASPELVAVAKLIIREWEADTTGVEPGALIARLSQYSIEARAALKKASVL